jgi:Spy/CpxP family protein refolding chaperone
MKKLLLSFLLVVAFAVPAFSQTMNMPMKEMGYIYRMGNMTDMYLRNADKIGLTDEQIKNIMPIRHEMQKKQARFKADVKIAAIEFVEIMEVKDFDIDKASTAIKKIADIKTAYSLEMLKSIKEVRTILTDEQFQIIKKMQLNKRIGKNRHKR